MPELPENRVKKVFRHSFAIAAIGFVVLSFALSAVVFQQENLLNRTLSSIGEKHRIWFLVWSLLFTIGTILNLKLLGLKLGIKGKKSFILSTILLVNIPLAVVQALIIDYSFHLAHILLAAIFSGYGLFTILTFLGVLITVKTRRRNKLYKRGFFYLLALAVIGFANLIAIGIYGQLIAAYQLALVYTCLIVVFLMQQSQKWSQTV